MGDKQSEKFFGYYSLWGSHSLDKSLAKYGFSRDDITDVFMTHLHFDHCGGSVQWNKNKTGYEPAFKTQKFWTNENHWEWATKPIPGRKHHSCPKIFYQCRKRTTELY
jgi:glyoxylase-like metal-dependent hydrolase (beta-lactamase superfamily II)